MKAGNIAMLVQRRLDSGEFQSAEIISGNPDVLVPKTQEKTSDAAYVYDVRAARKEFEGYICSREWTEAEKEMIPVFPEDMPVPDEVARIARREDAVFFVKRMRSSRTDCSFIMLSPPFQLQSACFRLSSA